MPSPGLGASGHQLPSHGLRAPRASCCAGEPRPGGSGRRAGPGPGPCGGDNWVPAAWLLARPRNLCGTAPRAGEGSPMPPAAAGQADRTFHTVVLAARGRRQRWAAPAQHLPSAAQVRIVQRPGLCRAGVHSRRPRRGRGRDAENIVQPGGNALVFVQANWTRPVVGVWKEGTFM